MLLNFHSNIKGRFGIHQEGSVCTEAQCSAVNNHRLSSQASAPQSTVSSCPGSSVCLAASGTGSTILHQWIDLMTLRVSVRVDKGAWKWCTWRKNTFLGRNFPTREKTWINPCNNSFQQLASLFVILQRHLQGQYFITEWLNLPCCVRRARHWSNWWNRNGRRKVLHCKFYFKKFASWRLKYVIDKGPDGRSSSRGRLSSCPMTQFTWYNTCKWFGSSWVHRWRFSKNHD